MDTIETNYDEFFGAYDGDDGNQTDTAEDTAGTEPTEEDTEPTAAEGGDDTHDKAKEESEGGETSEAESNQEADKDGADGEAEADKSVSEQKFVVKVNKETREVSYQDAPAWIQKGMDYDRVKGQLETAQQERDTLKEELDKSRPQMEILQMAAEQSGVTVEALLEGVQIGILKSSKGLTDAEARAEIRNLRLEKQIQDLTKQKQAAQEPAKTEAPADNKAERAQKDIEEFTRNFPDVKLTEELVNKLVPDVQKGMSLTSAYLKMENQRLRDEAKQRQQADAAKDKNKKNRAKTPGSMNDSGGQRTKTAEDDFFAAFEK